MKKDFAMDSSSWEMYIAQRLQAIDFTFGESVEVSYWHCDFALGETSPPDGAQHGNEHVIAR